MRLAGLSYERIAAELNYSSRSAAAQDVGRALERATIEQRASVELWRGQEIARLDRLQVAAWPAATSGDLRAIDTCVRIIDRRCKLLGLDAPQRLELITLDALDAQIRDLEQQLGSGDGAP